MEKHVRATTEKLLFAEDRKDGIFPGDIGNMERDKKYYPVDQWDNAASEFKPGWDLPEKTEIDDPRDEIGFGIRKEIKAYNRKRRCILFAQAFLGPNATDEQILAQARIAYQHIPDSAILASFKLWQASEGPADTPPPPAVEEVKTDSLEEVKEPVTAADQIPAPPAIENPAPPTEVKADEIPAEPAAVETVEETVVAPAEPAVAEAPAAPVAEEIKIEPPAAPAEVNVEEIETASEETEPEMEVEVQTPPPAVDTDIQLEDTAADPALENAFGASLMGDTPAAPACQACDDNPPAAPATVSAKVGASHLSQPKLTASKGQAVDWTQVWSGLNPNHI